MNLLLQISQCSNCPGAGRDFLYISLPTSKSLSSSSEPFFLGFFADFLADFVFLIFSIASFSDRLRFFVRVSSSSSSCSSVSCAAGVADAEASADASAWLDDPSPLLFCSVC